MRKRENFILVYFIYSWISSHFSKTFWLFCDPWMFKNSFEAHSFMTSFLQKFLEFTRFVTLSKMQSIFGNVLPNIIIKIRLFSNCFSFQIFFKFTLQFLWYPLHRMEESQRVKDMYILPNSKYLHFLSKAFPEGLLEQHMIQSLKIKNQDFLPNGSDDSSLGPIILLSPKSNILTSEFSELSSKTIFSGFISRWTIPYEWR